MEGFTGSDILKLAELLKQGDEAEYFDDKQKVIKSSQKTTPADVAKPKIIRNEETTDPEENLEKQLEKELESSDWKKTPQWNMIYKQAVTPSDVYLQMSGKTQLTSSCEEMVITVELPGENAANIDVKLQENNLKLTSPQFHLSIPLPHPVDPQKGNAIWDPTKQAIALTLVMKREFDFVNF